MNPPVKPPKKLGAILAATFVAAAAIFSSALAVEPPPTTVPTSAPTSNPATNASAAPLLPPEFELFQSRSAFSANGHTASAPAAGPVTPEASFVLRGIAQIDDHYIALCEDAAGKTAIQAGVGDAIGAGRVKSIDLDEVEYESSGQSKQISVGQNLKGETVPRPPTSQPAAPPGGTPGNGEQAGPPDGGPPQSPQHNPRPRRGK